MASQGTILYHGVEISERERDFLERSTAGISKVDESKLQDKKGHYEPSKGVKQNQDRMGRRWVLYAASHPGALVNLIASLEGFMLVVATGTLGKKGDDYYFRQLSDEEKKQLLQAGYQTIRNSWNNFCGWCKRMGHFISPDHKEHMTRYNKEFLRIIANLRDSVRESKFASDFHYGILAVHTFRQNNIQYRKPKVMIIQWAISSISFFGSHRIGEIAKSSAREDTEREKRGSHFKDVNMFAMFNERNGKTQLCIRFTKDKKGKENNPQDRGQTTFYEDTTGPLYENVFLFCLVILLARSPFRDYKSPNRRQLLQQLLDIKVTKQQRSATIHWEREFLEKPFFECSTKDSESIETASSLHRRHKDACYRAGLPNAPNFHDFRRKGLTNSDENNSEASRMRHGGHVKPGIFRGHYQPRETIDGAANFLGREQRKDVLRVSQELSVPYIPNLLQSLPAKELHDLQNSEEYQDIERQIDHEPSLREVGRLRRKLESLKLERLKWLRASQAFDDPPRYEHEIYSRVRFMKPERCRLEVNLFEEVEMRSEIGLQVIEDLLTIYLRDDKEVEFRPGLEPSLCNCDEDDWRHVLDCHKASKTDLGGFAEFCFLCHDWKYEKNDWEQHCQWHIDNPATIPVWIDPLMESGVLAAAGFCEFCLIDSRLPASDRMHQFMWRSSWREHYDLHYKDPQFKPKCRHQSFDSIKELQFHLYDWHGVPVPELSRQRKRRKQTEEEELGLSHANCKRQKIDEKEETDETPSFCNSTVDSIAMSLFDQRSSAKLLTQFDSNALQEPLEKPTNYPHLEVAKSDVTSGPYYFNYEAINPGHFEKEIHLN